MQALMRAHLGAVCKGAACSHALRLSLKNSNSDIIAGFSPQACWERTCSAYQCPLTFKLKDNAHETVDQSAEACCGKTCGSFRWPTGYHKKCSSIAGSSVDVCWGATGGVIACPYGSKKIADGASEKDVSTESYCKPTCDSITCSANQVKKKEAEKEKAEPCESIYCEKTCESFSCADGYTSKTEAAFLRAPSKDKCCEPSCKLLTCPRGFLKKPSLTKTDGLSAEACCDETCTACLKARGWKSQCKNGFLLRKDAGSVIAGSAQLAPERCCNPTCTGFSCPLGKQLIADAEKTFGTCESTCCEPTPCTSLACPPV